MVLNISSKLPSFNLMSIKCTAAGRTYECYVFLKMILELRMNVVCFLNDSLLFHLHVDTRYKRCIIFNTFRFLKINRVNYVCTNQGPIS